MTRSGARLLPDFIIIGSMKSGTTSLYRMLLDHPDIGMSRDKETDFFVAEKNFPQGADWYSGQFDPAKRLHGEASPNYTKADDFRGVPERIKVACPRVKLIYVVRDPVDRFVSQYRHSWTMGDIAMTPVALPQTPEYRHILDTSRYGRQLEAYLAHFPREQILVLDFDTLIRTPQLALDEVLAFIGAPPCRFEASGAFNENAEVSRVPAFVLRFAQSRLGRAFSRVVNRENRDSIRRLVARGKARQPEPFPADVLDKVRGDLREDVATFRRISGQRFAQWSL